MMQSGATIHDLVDRVIKHGCQIPSIAHGQEEYCCGEEVITFCGDCGTNLCTDHAVKCCMETCCESCAALHRQRGHR